MGVSFIRASLEVLCEKFGPEFKPEYDGKIHRFKPTGASGKSGWSVGFSSNGVLYLIVSDFRDGDKYLFSNIDKISKKDKDHFSQEYVKKIAEIEENRIKYQLELKDLAQSLVKHKVEMDDAKASAYPYFNKKLIDKKYGSIFIESNEGIFAAIPMQDEHGEIWNYQRIYQDGSKKFMPGRVSGLYFVIPGSSDSFLCEGFATGVTIHKATGATVYVAFNAANIVNVAEILDKKNVEVGICADDDKWNEKNVGKDYAYKAASIGNSRVYLPKFKNESSKPTDFNDIECLEDLDAVKNCINRVKHFSVTLDEVIANTYGCYEHKENPDTGLVFSIPDYIGMSNLIRLANVMKFSDSGNYAFRGGYWQYVQNTELDSIILQLTKNECKPNHFDGFKRTLRAGNFFDISSINQSEEGYINLKNGILNIKTKELIPHSSQFFFKQILPISYNPTAVCPEWDKYLNFVLKGDADLIGLAQEIFGYIIMGGEPIFHKAFVLYGSGRNGKSTFLDILRKLLGRESYSSVSMGKLHKEFSAVGLVGKLANIVEETPDDEINSEIFKTMVGGGFIHVSHKGKDEFDAKINARFIFACNDMPIFKDKNQSMLDRLVFLPFEVYIKENERDTGIIPKLTAELPGILNWAIAGAEKVTKNHAISNPKKTVDLKEAYREDSDSVFAWSKECIDFGIIADSKGSRTKFLTSELYQKYESWCGESGVYAVGINKFSKRFTKIAHDAMPYAKQPKVIITDCGLSKRGKGYEDLRAK